MSWAAAIPAIAGLAGDLIGGSTASHEATKNRRFQERMRSTQYQTAVADMKKAGINPMLAFSQGGAGTPSGAQANGYDISNPAMAYYSAQQAKQNVKNSQQQQSLIAAQEAAARSNALNLANSAANSAALARLNNAEAEKAELTRLPYVIMNNMLQDPSSATAFVRQMFFPSSDNEKRLSNLFKGLQPLNSTNSTPAQN